MMTLCINKYESFDVILNYTLPCDNDNGDPCPMFDPMEAENQQIIAPRRSIDIEFNICEVVNRCECDVEVFNLTHKFFCEFEMLLLQRLIGMWKVSL